MFLAGEFIKKEKTVEVKNPYDDKVIEKVGLSDEADIEKAVSTAQKGFGFLKDMPAGERARILERTAEIMTEKKEDFARTIALESGKTINEARGEVVRAINTMKLSAIAALELNGETVRFDLGGRSKKLGFYIRVPLGVVLAITPFNFPLNLSCHKIGPAIAAGNAVIHKPATKTPLSALKLARALIDAGLPKQGISVLVGSGARIGLALVRHPAIKKISFTGSLDVGRTIMENCGMKRVTMELGSNSAVVVFRDAPLEFVAKKVRKGGYTLAGQVCISIQRVYVEEDIADEFVRLLSMEVNQIKYGDQLDEETEMGPMIDEPAIKKAEQFCEDAIDRGGILILGGRRDGNIFLPTILLDAPEDALVIQEEAFAPIVVVNKFKTLDEVIDKVNNTKYGLQAGVFTRDISKGLECARRIEAGGVLINEFPTFRVDNMPYGGTKGSGIGREGPKFAIKEMTEEKLIILDQIE
ncbi:aldehyde dehydrogenase [candidate division WOR-3 bacterium 4484_100]|uniref:Aldehyde dehydrogenase n=1 Tax=candidate division WOR-3 bacterium 4484_100 TaxID=1936077 RepID=A0A1V4QE07_UNCW3|nr:MAG: aldehyde dehydrogenase [candidate division WOR-3 bacterium 4484_100]